MTSADKIALAAAFIAACAFVVTLWQAHVARAHNRLSVRPLLVWSRDRVITEAGVEIAFTVRNFGIGPAMIERRFFTVDGSMFEAPAGSSDEVEALVHAVFGTPLPCQLKQHGLPGVGAAIPQGGEHVIAKLFFQNYRAEAVDAMVKELPKVAFQINYKSLYRESYTLIAE
jgi:hypothetical protein